jgi:hypothetical protein
VFSALKKIRKRGIRSLISRLPARRNKKNLLLSQRFFAQPSVFSALKINPQKLESVHAVAPFLEENEYLRKTNPFS